MSKWTKALKIQIFISSILTIYYRYAYPNAFKDPGIEILNKYGSGIVLFSLITSYILLLYYFQILIKVNILSVRVEYLM